MNCSSPLLDARVWVPIARKIPASDPSNSLRARDAGYKKLLQLASVSANCFLKDSSVRRSPSSRFTLGSQPNRRRAFEMSGQRWRGASCGRGSKKRGVGAANKELKALTKQRNG